LNSTLGRENLYVQSRCYALKTRLKLTQSLVQFAAVLEMKHSFSSLRQSDLSHQLSSYSVDQNDIVLEQTDNALRQTQVSLYQNSAIQRLTYLTIGYLPLGLMSVRPIPPNPISYLGSLDPGVCLIASVKTRVDDTTTRLYSQFRTTRRSTSSAWVSSGSWAAS